MFDMRNAIGLQKERRNRVAILQKVINASLSKPLPIGLEDELRMCFRRRDFNSESALAEALERYSIEEITHFICHIMRGDIEK